jgi:hypothetical protein
MTKPKCEAPRLQGGASRSLIILFRYMPLDPAYKAGLARHETGQMNVKVKIIKFRHLDFIGHLDFDI